jgi:hypothetical protein
VRSYANDVGASLAGEDRPLALDGDALASETPGSVTADIAILYAGTRLLDEVNDPMPAAGGATGVILTDQAVCRVLPRAALARFPVVRVGIVGRSPEPCELSLQLVELRGEAAGAPYGNPGTLKVGPSADLATHWIELPEHQPLGATVALALRATSGRFFWVGKDRGLARVAVRDPDPGGRVVTIAGKPFALGPGDATPAAGAAHAPPARAAHAPLASFPRRREPSVSGIGETLGSRLRGNDAVTPILPGDAVTPILPGDAVTPALASGRRAAPSDADRYEWRGVSLPAPAFAGRPPRMSSLLFATVNIRDLTLRYARQVRT